MTSTDLTRRAVLAGAGALCATCAVGCATYTSGSSAAPAPAPAGYAPAGSAPTGSAPAAPAQPTTPAAPPPEQGIAAAADIPVGGGTVFAEQGVVVTQPTAGTYQAFGIVCPHQGCEVDAVTDGAITCPCHGSRFAVADGAPTGGPASSPLERRQVTVTGGRVVLA